MMDSHQQHSTGIRILLIEDNSTFARLVERALAKMPDHFILDHQMTLRGGMRRLEKEEFDIVLLDLTLPDSRGLAGLMRLKRLVPTTPIIILTALDSEQLSLEAIDRGAQDYILKDYYHLDLLKQSIQHAIARQEQLLENKQLTQSLREKKRELEKKNKRLARLYAVIHHSMDSFSQDFHEPLEEIRKAAGAILSNDVGHVAPNSMKQAESIERKCLELKSMVDDLIDTRKMEGGLMVPRRREVSPTQLMSRLQDHFPRRFPEGSLRLNVQIPQNCPHVFCDPDHIRQALNRILASSRDEDSAEIDATVTVSVPRGRGEVLFEISLDHESEKLPETEPAQNDASPSAEQPSPRSATTRTLGLEVARDLIALNLGCLKVQDRAPRGCSFSFSLPVMEEETVTRRYPIYLRDRGEEAFSISSLILETPIPTRNAQGDEVHSFLENLLRQNDLLFRVAPHRWRVLLQANKTEREYFLLRLHREIAAGHQLIPESLLPELRIRGMQTWKLDPDDEDSFLPTIQGMGPSHYATLPKISAADAQPFREQQIFRNDLP